MKDETSYSTCSIYFKEKISTRGEVRQDGVKKRHFFLKKMKKFKKKTFKKKIFTTLSERYCNRERQHLKVCCLLLVVVVCIVLCAL